VISLSYVTVSSLYRLYFSFHAIASSLTIRYVGKISEIDQEKLSVELKRDELQVLIS
jgi:hypothetical protein